MIRNVESELKATQQRVQALSTLNLIARTLATVTDLPAAIQLVAETTTHLFNSHGITISLFNSARSEMTLVAHHIANPEAAGLTGLTFPVENEAIALHLIKTNQSIVIPHAQTNSLTKLAHDFLRAWGVDCLMFIPLLTRGEIIGFITIGTDQPNRVFTPAEVTLAETIAGQIAGAIEVARLFDEERRQRQIAESLREVVTVLNGSLDQKTVLTKMMEQLDRVIQNDGGGVCLQDGDDLLLSMGIGAAKPYIGRRIPLISQHPCARVFNTRQLLLINDITAESHWEMWPGSHGIKSWIGAPLFVGPKVIGVLTVDSFKAGAYREEDSQILQTFANQAALAIENARLFEALRQSEAHYRAVVEGQTELICRFQLDGTLTFANEAYCRYFEIPPEELERQNFVTSIYETDQAALQLNLALLTPQNPTTSLEERVMMPGREMRWQQWNVQAFFDEVGRVIEYQGVGRDITERKQLEEQLRQSQKIEAVGQLAGGVAHHFNNMLTAMIGYLTLSLEMLPANHPAVDDLHLVKSTAQRAATLTRQLLAFTRKQVIQPRAINLNDLILSLQVMLRQLIPESIELITQLAPDLDQVKIDVNQFEQLLVHLLVNARDAMPAGGQLALQTTNVTLNLAYAGQYASIPPGHYVLLEVIDTGMGMTEGVKEHIFEPFFTTKEVGQGTGLGLSTCFGIVKQHEGHILVDSSLGQGTTFKIYFPRFKQISIASKEDGIFSEAIYFSDAQAKGSDSFGNFSNSGLR